MLLLFLFISFLYVYIFFWEMYFCVVIQKKNNVYLFLWMDVVCVCVWIRSFSAYCFLLHFFFIHTLRVWLFVCCSISLSWLYTLMFFKTLTLSLSIFFSLFFFLFFIILLRRKIYKHIMCQNEFNCSKKNKRDFQQTE